MSFVLSMKDTYKQAVESATGGRNTVMYDDLGNPSIMAKIPKFKLSDIFSSWPNQTHPAFIVDGVEKDAIYVSKYQNIVHNGRAYSLPNQDPETNINFDDSRDACFAKGEGWHLLTNAEWSAVALWCMANGTQPRGNTDYGASHEASYERGVHAGHELRIASGSGPASWNHDHTPIGIADLCGNIWEWVDGFKTIDGRVFVHPDNDYKTGNDEDSTDGWQDLEKYFDYDGDVIINDERTSVVEDSSVDTNFKDIVAADGVNIPDVMKYLGLYKPDDDSEIAGDNVWMRNEGERLPRRGGGWSLDSRAGVFSLTLRSTRTFTFRASGFRSAYISE